MRVLRAYLAWSTGQKNKYKKLVALSFPLSRFSSLPLKNTPLTLLSQLAIEFNSTSNVQQRSHHGVGDPTTGERLLLAVMKGFRESSNLRLDPSDVPRNRLCFARLNRWWSLLVESIRAGRGVRWARRVSRRLRVHVVVGLNGEGLSVGGVAEEGTVRRTSGRATAPFSLLLLVMKAVLGVVGSVARGPII